MNTDCIVSQVHIAPKDEMSGVHQDVKLFYIELALEHLRKNNPNSYITFIGHGKRPKQKILDLCDHVDWESDYDLHRKPAQYNYVGKGINHCREMGFNKILKVRGDGIYFIPNFCSWCNDILEAEKKDLLITQMTAKNDYKLGDCVMYGKSELVDFIWDVNSSSLHWDGLIHTGRRFYNYYRERMQWLDMLRKHCSFRNIYNLKWMDIRFNCDIFDKIGRDIVRELVLNNQFNYFPYLWGATNGWHRFDKNGKMISSIEDYYLEEETFYENI